MRIQFVKEVKIRREIRIPTRLLAHRMQARSLLKVTLDAVKGEMRMIRSKIMERREARKGPGHSWVHLETQTTAPNSRVRIENEILENIAYSIGDRAH